MHDRSVVLSTDIYPQDRPWPRFPQKTSITGSLSRPAFIVFSNDVPVAASIQASRILGMDVFLMRRHDVREHIGHLISPGDRPSYKSQAQGTPNTFALSRHRPDATHIDILWYDAPFDLSVVSFGFTDVTERAQSPAANAHMTHAVSEWADEMDREMALRAFVQSIPDSLWDGLDIRRGLQMVFGDVTEEFVRVYTKRAGAYDVAHERAGEPFRTQIIVDDGPLRAPSRMRIGLSLGGVQFAGFLSISYANVCDRGLKPYTRAALDGERAAMSSRFIGRMSTVVPFWRTGIMGFDASGAKLVIDSASNWIPGSRSIIAVSNFSKWRTCVAGMKRSFDILLDNSKSNEGLLISSPWSNPQGAVERLRALGVPVNEPTPVGGHLENFL